MAKAGLGCRESPVADWATQCGFPKGAVHREYSLLLKHLPGKPQDQGFIPLAPQKQNKKIHLDLRTLLGPV